MRELHLAEMNQVSGGLGILGKIATASALGTSIGAAAYAGILTYACHTSQDLLEAATCRLLAPIAIPIATFNGGVLGLVGGLAAGLVWAAVAKYTQ